MKDNAKVIEWVKSQIDKKFAKDFDYKEIKAYYSCDRPHPDLIVECKTNDDKTCMFRFLVV